MSALVSMTWQQQSPLTACVVMCCINSVRGRCAMVRLLAPAPMPPMPRYASVFQDDRGASRALTHEDVERAARQANAHNFIMQFPQGYVRSSLPSPFIFVPSHPNLFRIPQACILLDSRALLPSVSPSNSSQYRNAGLKQRSLGKRGLRILCSCVVLLATGTTRWWVSAGSSCRAARNSVSPSRARSS